VSGEVRSFSRSEFMEEKMLRSDTAIPRYYSVSFVLVETGGTGRCVEDDRGLHVLRDMIVSAYDAIDAIVQAKLNIANNPAFEAEAFRLGGFWRTAEVQPAK